MDYCRIVVVDSSHEKARFLGLKFERCGLRPALCVRRTCTYMYAQRIHGIARGQNRENTKVENVEPSSTAHGRQ